MAAFGGRLGLAEGESKYDDLEKKLAAGPVITVPTITLEGDANGAAHHPDDTPYRKKSGGKYANRIIKGGIGHNLPQASALRTETPSPQGNIRIRRRWHEQQHDTAIGSTRRSGRRGHPRRSRAD